MALNRVTYGRGMLEPLLEIGVLDVIDILLVAVLVYTIIVLVRRTQAGFVAIGILIAVPFLAALIYSLASKGKSDTPPTATSQPK